MGIIQYDGIIFADVADLIAYKKAIESNANTAERQETRPQKVVIVQEKQPFIPSKAKGKNSYPAVAKYHQIIEDFYRQHFMRERIKNKKVKKLAKMLKLSENTIKHYAYETGIISALKAAKRHDAKANDQEKQQAKPKKGRREYTKEQIAAVLDSSKTLEQIGKEIGRSAKSVSVKRTRLLKDPKNKALYMRRRKALKPLSYPEAMISRANKESAPESPGNALEIYPLTKQSIETLGILLKDAAERGNLITFPLAKSNLSLIDNLDFTQDRWQDIINQIMRQADKIHRLFGIKVFFQPANSSLKAT